MAYSLFDQPSMVISEPIRWSKSTAWPVAERA
jgi:hypothetical protein